MRRTISIILICSILFAAAESSKQLGTMVFNNVKNHGKEFLEVMTGANHGLLHAAENNVGRGAMRNNNIYRQIENPGRIEARVEPPVRNTPRVNNNLGELGVTGRTPFIPHNELYRIPETNFMSMGPKETFKVTTEKTVQPPKDPWSHLTIEDTYNLYSMNNLAPLVEETLPQVAKTVLKEAPLTSEVMLLQKQLPKGVKLSPPNTNTLLKPEGLKKEVLVEAKPEPKTPVLQTKPKEVVENPEDPWDGLGPKDAYDRYSANGVEPQMVGGNPLKGKVAESVESSLVTNKKPVNSVVKTDGLKKEVPVELKPESKNPMDQIKPKDLVEDSEDPWDHLKLEDAYGRYSANGVEPKMVGGNRVKGNVVIEEAEVSTMTKPKETSLITIDSTGNKLPEKVNKIESSLKTVPERTETLPVEVKKGTTDLVAKDTANTLPSTVKPETSEVVLFRDNHFEVIEFEKPMDNAIAEFKPLKGELMVQEAQETGLVKVKEGGNALVEVKSQPNSLVEIKPQPNALVEVGSKPNALVEVKAQPNSLVEVKPQPNSLVEVKPQPNSLVEVKPVEKGLTKIHEMPKDLQVIKPVPKDLMVRENKVTDLALLPKEETGLVPYRPLTASILNMSRFGLNNSFQTYQFLKMQNAKNFGGMGPYPSFSNRPLVVSEPVGKPSSSLTQITMKKNTQGRFGSDYSFDSHVQSAVRKGLETGTRIPGKGKFLELNEKYQKLKGKSSGALSTLRYGGKYPHLYNSFYFGNSPFSQFYRSWYDRQLELSRIAMGPSTRNTKLKLSPDLQNQFSQTYIGMQAQLATQYQMSGAIQEALESMAPVLKNSPLVTSEKFLLRPKTANSLETVEYFEDKKLPIPFDTQVFIDVKKGIVATDKLSPSLWDKVYKRNKYLTKFEPITAFKGINPNSDWDKLATIRSKIPKYVPTRKAVAATHTEYKLTPLPPNYSYDIMMDLPLHNYLLNIEELCLDEFRAEYCDVVTTKLYEAVTKFGQVVRRKYDLIQVEVAVLLEREFPDLFAHIQETGKFEEFKEYSQSMFDRLEYLLVTYKDVPATK